MTEELTAEFFGESFALAEKIGRVPLMEYAKVAQLGLHSDHPDALVALYDLLEDCFASEEEWGRFRAVARKAKADGDELVEVVKTVFEKVTERPTSRPSDSSDGPPATPERSEAGASRAEQLLPGRPDLQIAVLRAERSLTA